MAEVPVVIVATIFPRDKTVKPYPATITGWAHIAGLEVGGGPILPPDQVPQPEPPLVIWGGPIDPYPDHGLPTPPTPPDKPPTPPVPPHEGWNWSAAKSGWYYLYVPGPSAPGPKK